MPEIIKTKIISQHHNDLLAKYIEIDQIDN